MLEHYVIVVQMLARLQLGVLYSVFVPCGNRKDTIKLQRAQRRFERLLPGLEGLNYRERLGRLGLYFLGVQEAEG